MNADLPLHVETCGPPPRAGADVYVLLHGFGASAFTWRHLAPRLAERGHVVLVDIKGFGSAPKPDDGVYSPGDLAELVHRLLIERDLSRVTLVGHSLGGGISLLTALRLLDEGADRLHRLVLISSAAYPQRLPPFVGLARRPRLSAFLFWLLGPRRVIRVVLRKIFFDKTAVTPEQIEGYADPLEERAAREALLWVGSRVLPPDIDALNARFPQIEAPTLLIWGRHDLVIPLWVGERLSRELPRAEFVVFERCGHVPPEELPNETYEAVASFLDRTGDSERSSLNRPP
jgi:pimeloyl-ACP methyl ester carboxylesterase